MLIDRLKVFAPYRVLIMNIILFYAISVFFLPYFTSTPKASRNDIETKIETLYIPPTESLNTWNNALK